MKDSYTLEAGTAYLPIEKEIAALITPEAKLHIVFNEDVETGISSVQNSEAIVHRNDKAVYDLQGRRVTSLTPGVYIRSGKKMILK